MKFLKIAILTLVVFAGLSALCTWLSAPPTGALPATGATQLARGHAADVPDLEPAVVVPAVTVASMVAPVPAKTAAPKHVKVMTPAKRDPRDGMHVACDPFGPRGLCEEHDLLGGSGGKVMVCSCDR